MPRKGHPIPAENTQTDAMSQAGAPGERLGLLYRIAGSNPEPNNLGPLVQRGHALDGQPEARPFQAAAWRFPRVRRRLP
jgi:hypothetical protein